MKINELSNDKLADYKKKAGADASEADKRGDYKRGDKRFRGIVKATKKQFANDIKKHKKVDEALKQSALDTLVKAKEEIEQKRKEELAQWEADFRANNRSRIQSAVPQQVQPEVSSEKQTRMTKNKIRRQIATIDSILRLGDKIMPWVERYQDQFTPGLKADLEQIETSFNQDNPDYDMMAQLYSRFYDSLRQFIQQKKAATSKKKSTIRRELQRPSPVVYRRPEEVAEGEITEEMIAARLMDEWIKASGTKPKDNSILQKKSIDNTIQNRATQNTQDKNKLSRELQMWSNKPKQPKGWRE
jgi:hypothetical protein